MLFLNCRDLTINSGETSINFFRDNHYYILLLETSSASQTKKINLPLEVGKKLSILFKYKPSSAEIEAVEQALRNP